MRGRRPGGWLRPATHESLSCVGTRVTFVPAKRLLVHRQGGSDVIRKIFYCFWQMFIGFISGETIAVSLFSSALVARANVRIFQNSAFT
uniref:Uncharacterized protein n=1 Tax=Trichogramma kaykai TaxID=54128 RepID=A0ABD2WQN5_9HYME